MRRKVSSILFSSLPLLSLLCAGGTLFAAVTTADPLENPALLPVSVHEAESHPDLELVRNGELTFAVMISLKGGPEARKAANLLRDAFYRCTGKIPKLFVENHSSPNETGYFKTMIYVGKTDAADKKHLKAESLPRGGFRIHSSRNAIYLVGFDSRIVPGFYDNGKNRKIQIQGTVHGVYDFMERFLGVRIYLPGEFGSIWPQIRNLTLRPMSYSDYPRIQNVNQGYFLSTGFTEPQRWNALFQTENLGGPLPTGKGIPPISETERMAGSWRFRIQMPYRALHMPAPKNVAEAYPERMKEFFFRSAEGKLYYNGSSTGSYFDVTNPLLADMLVAEYKKFLHGEKSVFEDGDIVPSREYLPFGQCDSDVRTEDMRAAPTVQKLGLLDHDNGFGEIYGRFTILLAERLKKECPDSRLSVIAYANYKRPPASEEFRRFPDNVDVQICPGNLPGLIRHTPTRESWQKLFRDWQEVLGGRSAAGIWLYNEALNPFARAVVPALTGETLRQLGGAGSLEVFFDYYGSLEWCYYYASYVMYRSLWNPEFNVQAALDEHWELFYGPEAGPVLKEFHQLLTESYDKYISASGNQRTPFPPEVLDRLEALLKKAGTILGDNSSTAAAGKTPPPPARKQEPEIDALDLLSEPEPIDGDIALLSEEMEKKQDDGTPVELKRFRVFAEPWAKAIAAQRNLHRKNSPERPPLPTPPREDSGK